MSRKDLEKYLIDIFDKRRMNRNGNYPEIGEVKNNPGMYHLGNGTYTGRVGWENFNKMLKEQTNELD